VDNNPTDDEVHDLSEADQAMFYLWQQIEASDETTTSLQGVSRDEYLTNERTDMRTNLKNQMIEAGVGADLADWFLTYYFDN
jgi:hypothetical protein